jgi:large subunit ribosomal protein L14
MIQLGTVVKVTDKTGAVLAQCIKVLGSTGKRIAYVGDLIMVSIRWLNAKRLARAKERHRKRYSKGTIHRGLIVRSCKNARRFTGILVRFNENAVVFVNRKVVPVSNRVYGPVLHEFCTRWPSLGCVTRCII